MSSNWIQHVKNYQNQHGVDYKTAMQLAKSSYKKTGGAIKPKNLLRKAKNSVNRAVHEMDKHQELINLVDKQGIAKKARKTLNKTQEVLDVVDGSGFNLHNAVRKGKNTVKKVKKVSKNASKYYEMVKPGLEMIPGVGNIIDYADAANSGVKIANELTGGKVKRSKRRNSNKYINAMSGGSFKTAGSFKTHGEGMRTDTRPAMGSSMLSPMHPSFMPKTNSLSNRLKTNNI